MSISEQPTNQVPSTYLYIGRINGSLGFFHSCIKTNALFGWRIQPESASHNSIFLSREISQLFSQTVFSSHAKSASQPASQPAEQAVNFQPPKLHRFLYGTGTVEPA